MSSCGLLQHVDKTKEKYQGSYQQNDQLVATDLDTGKIVTTRKWTLGSPVIDKKDLEQFVPRPPQDFGADQSGLKDAFLDMQTKYQDLYSLAKNGWMTLEERISEQKGKASTATGRSERSGEVKTEDSHIEKKPDRTVVFIIAGIGLLFCGILLIFMARLASKVNAMAKFVQTIKPL